MNNIKMLYYDRIDVAERIDLIKQMHQKSVIFVANGIFETKCLSFHHMQ